MIIKTISAHNVLKYADLTMELSDAGLIGITGKNESGKSSIGEIVCFVLFGRTFSIGPEELHRIVRWGEDTCTAALGFSVEDRQYLLTRFLDRDGRHGAKLAPADTPDEPMARGVGDVADALLGVLGIDYEQFIESFYLAQREITTPHPHSQSIRVMAGIAPLEQVAGELTDAITEREKWIAGAKADEDLLRRDIEAVGFEEDRLKKLEQTRHRTREQIDRIGTLVDDLDKWLERCLQHIGLLSRVRKSKRRAAFWRSAFLLLALGTGGAWALLRYGGTLPLADAANDLLSQAVPSWETGDVMWIGAGAAGLGVLFLLSWLRVAGVGRRVARLSEASGELWEAIDAVRSSDATDLGDRGDQDGSEASPGPAENTQAAEGDEAPLRSDDAEYRALRISLERGDLMPQTARDCAQRENVWLHHASDQLTGDVAALEAQIEEEQRRQKQVQDLSSALTQLTDKPIEVSAEIADRRRGLELLEGAMAHLSHTFNRDVKDLVARTLPLFTEGRYGYLQLGEDLKVRVFSTDKRDFVDLDEVSSGTQRQIVFALRLALSRKLLGRSVKGKQFAFLDEPFAFFDAERTCGALEALATLDTDISQVWIVAQDFPDNCKVPFDTRIRCERTSDTLTVQGRDASEGRS